MSLTFEQIRERLAARFGDAVGATVAAKDPFVVVKGEKLLELARYLHDDPDLALDYLVDATAVDYPKENLLRVVYHLWSVKQKQAFKFKVECDRANPKVSSVESVWRAANWLEREAFDLLGVVFEGHPDLRRLMMPEDWVGHPLRKDYKDPESYHGLSHQRVSQLDQNLARDKALRAAQPQPPPGPAAAAAPAKPAGELDKMVGKLDAQVAALSPKPVEPAKAEEKPAEAKPAEPAKAETKPAETKTEAPAAPAQDKPAEPKS
ncbi:MAG TPA: NADH-quinone oxidoreductase subunit C [Myxococcales bacterium]|jgi:NADH-quinone oxidoreductase subunit C